MKSIKKFVLFAYLLHHAVIGNCQVSAQFSVNDQDIAAGSSAICFINNPLVLQSHCTGEIVSYSLTVTDASSHVVATTGTVHSSVPSTIDLYNGMCDGAADCIPLSNTLLGNYTVNLTVADNSSHSNSYSTAIILSRSTSNPASVSFKLNNSTVSAGSNTNFNGIGSLEMENNSTGDIVLYNIEVWDAGMQNILYTTGYVYAAPSSTIDMFNMCGDGTCTSLNPHAYGTYNVKFWASSTGVGDPYASSSTALISINPAVTSSGNPPHASFTINDRDISTTEATPFYNYESLILRNTSGGDVAVYKIDILAEDMRTVLYSTGFVEGNFDNINLFDMCREASGACSSLNGTIAGTFGVSLTLSPCCSYDNVYTSVHMGLIAIIPPFISTNTTLITACINTSTNAQDNYMTANTSTSNPDKVGRTSTIFSFLDPRYNRLYVSNYTIALSNWDAASASWRGPMWSNTFSNPTSGPTLSPYAQPISAIGGNGFFNDPNNAPNGSMWKIDVTLQNDGSTYTETEVFQVDDNSHL